MSKLKKLQVQIQTLSEELTHVSGQVAKLEADMCFWKGAIFAYKNMAKYMDNILHEIKLAMDWLTLTEKDRKKYAKLSKIWNNTSELDRSKIWGEYLPDFEKLSDREQKIMVSKPPFSPPATEITESQGEDLVRTLSPIVNYVRVHVEQANTQPKTHENQAVFARSTAKRLEARISSLESAKSDEKKNPSEEKFNEDYHLDA